MQKILLLLFYLCCSAMIAHEVFLTVPQSSQQFVIDGTDAEKQYANALILENFFTANTAEQAQEQTSVKILHDKSNLYLFFELYEFALNPASNQLKAFKANLKGTNQPVWHDDCAEIRLAGNDGKIRYFGFNANGASKNIGFDSFKVKSKILNNRWVAEVALPLPEGEKIRLGITRFEKRIPEKSSYTQLPDDNHNTIKNMAVLTLGDKNTPGIRTPDWGKLKRMLPILYLSRPLDCKWRLSVNNIVRDGVFTVQNGKRIRLRPQKKFDGIVNFYGEIEYNNKLIFRSPLYKFGEIAVSAEMLNIDNTKIEKQKISSLAVQGIRGDNFYLSANGTYPLVWNILKSQNIDFALLKDDLILNLLLPEFLEITGVESKVSYPDGFAPFNWPAEKNSYRFEFLKKQKIGNSFFNHYQIIRTYPLVRNNKMPLNHQNERERAIISIKANKNCTNKNGNFYYFCSNKNFTEAPRTYQYTVLPEIKTVQPAKTIISLRANSLKDLKNISPVLQTLASAGVNELFVDTAMNFKPFGIKSVSFVNFERYPWKRAYPDLASFMSKYPDCTAVNAYGKRTDAISFSYIAEHPEIWEEFSTAIKNIRNRFPHLDKILWDFEFDPFKGLYSDYSPAALKAFRKRFNIAENIELTPQIIAEKYSSQWIDFRCYELGRFSAVLKKAFAKTNLPFAFYSDYDSPQAIAMYGLDWQYIAPHADFAYMGYGRDTKMIENTRRKLPQTPLIFGVLTSTGTGEISRAKLLRRIVDSRCGVLCWYEKGFSALELTEIAAVAKVLEKYENIILNGNKDSAPTEIKGIFDDNIEVLTLDKTKIVIIFNESNLQETISFKFNLPLENISDGRKYSAGSTVSTTIGPGSFQIFSTL